MWGQFFLFNTFLWLPEFGTTRGGNGVLTVLEKDLGTEDKYKDLLCLILTIKGANLLSLENVIEVLFTSCFLMETGFGKNFWVWIYFI